MTKDYSSARIFTAEEIHARNGTKNPKKDKGFWTVIDGYVVDASGYGKDHPGKIKKLLAANSPKIGATGKWFGFSFSKGPNAHFSGTARFWKEECKRFLGGMGTQKLPRVPHRGALARIRSPRTFA